MQKDTDGNSRREREGVGKVPELTSSQKFLLGLYLLLLLLCTALIIIADFLSPTVRASLLPISTDGFKTVLGAVLGALSVLLGVKSR